MAMHPPPFASARKLERGLAARIEVADALDLDRLGLAVGHCDGREVLHVFGDDNRARYADSLATVLRITGACYLVLFSNQQLETWSVAAYTRTR
jgi:hypothetical protein